MLGSIFYPLSRIITAAVVFFTSIFGGAGLQAAVGNAPPSLDPLPYPRWTHEHLVWEHHGTEDSAMEFVKGFTSRDIPVGIVNIEADWATARNSYVPSDYRYPNMQDMIDRFHAQDIRVIMWTCQMVNDKVFYPGDKSKGEANPDYVYAKEKGYLLSNGKTVKWWGGEGALLDYTNPEAVEWHHGLMDNILDMGVDGWKCDGTDPYIWLLFPAWSGKTGFVRFRQYQRLSYRDFYDYTMEKTGGDAMVWARPTDDAIGFGLPLNFMPRDINFAGWVGDQYNDWAGLRGALNNMFTSAMLNYVNFGSDIGGFRWRGENYEDVFVRWAQLGAFSTIMNNGGGGEHRPWKYDEARADGKHTVTDIYRKFTKLHYELIPYMASSAAWSHERRQPTMRPQFGVPYQYMLGDDILVAPMYQEGNDRTVVFPLGEWIYMFDESKVYKAGMKKLHFPLDEFPVFIRKGAIFPMEGFGEDFTTVRVYPMKGSESFGLYEQDVRGTMLSYTLDKNGLTITTGVTERALMFRVHGQDAPLSVALSGKAVTSAASLDVLKRMDTIGYFADAEGILWIAVPDAAAGIEITITY